MRYRHPPKPNQPCVECKTMFKAIGTKQKFCTRGCWIKYKTEHGLGKNTGMKHSNASRSKMSSSQKIRFNTGPHYSRDKKLPQRSGKNHHFWDKKRPEVSGANNVNWKGGISKNSRFNSDYKIWRSRVFARDNYTCQVCDTIGGYLQADHIKRYADYPELRYEISNGRTLCVACHYYVTFKRKMPQGIVWGSNKRVDKF